MLYLKQLVCSYAFQLNLTNIKGYLLELQSEHTEYKTTNNI